MIEFTTGDNKQIYVKKGEFGIEWKPVNGAQWDVIEDEDFIVWPLEDDGLVIHNTKDLIYYVS